jgi:glutathione S-transferase
MHIKLITIGVSHYCEKARWALDLAGLDFTEDAHAPIFHIPYVKSVGAGRTVPVLVAERVIGDSTEILKWIGAHPASTWDPYEHEAALEWEEKFDQIVGPHARRLAYGWMLPHKDLVMTMMHGKAKTWESRSLQVSYPLAAAGLRKSLNITPDGVARSKAKLDAIFAEVAEVLDGRDYIVGDKLSAADLTFAALAAPLVLPKGYGWTMPVVEDLPDEIREEVEAYRNHPAGQFVMKTYDAHR